MDASSTPTDAGLTADAPPNPKTETLRRPSDDGPARVGGLTDVGRVREFNEDNLHWEDIDRHTALYAVADGMGGHDRGEVASQVAVDSLFDAARRGLKDVSEREPFVLRELMREFMQTANHSVIAKGEEHNSNMGTTLCAALVHKNDAIIANVGDSRVYLLRQGELIRVSQDHSLVGFLETLGELSRSEARNHPSGNILVRSIGSVPEVEIDVFHVETQDGDRILLCSDGLWGEIEDHEIAAMLIATDDCQKACVDLVDLANENGGRDNSTLVLVTIQT
jgi:protein phosphatase